MTYAAIGARRARQSAASRRAMVEHLLAHAAGLANDQTMASLLAGWTLGAGCLPADFGLGREVFEARLRAHFPTLGWRLAEDLDLGPGEARKRALELDDLVVLLRTHADREVAGSLDMACIVAHGCLGADHLWQDLGLDSRQELGTLMRRNFPQLAARNDRDMKWKKFLYRQLCETEGVFVCRAPTCEVCHDFTACFGPEH